MTSSVKFESWTQGKLKIKLRNIFRITKKNVKGPTPTCGASGGLYVNCRSK